MMEKEDSSPSASRGTYQSPGLRKTYWRSASWSSSRTPCANQDSTDPSDSTGSNTGQGRRFPVPVTPRAQLNCKARSCLPPLQPLSIERKSFDDWPKAGLDDIGEWFHPPTPSGRNDLCPTGERLKLDLSVIQRNLDKNGGLPVRDKIACFERVCSKVADHIYLGGDMVAKDRDILKSNGVTHVLNCVGSVCKEYFKSDFVYRTLWLHDSPSEDITSILYDVFDYFEDVREQHGKVLVHCCQGVSRSTSLVIAYLMWREGQSFEDAFEYVKEAREIADPNMGFTCQLMQCQKRVHAFPLSPSSLLRMYRMAPHSPHDPLHLVPKMLHDPSPGSLDSRGAFIIHIPTAIYIWIGKKCEAVVERDARGAVCQIVRYEKAYGEISLILEGEEPTRFWDSFSNFLPLMDKRFGGVDAIELSGNKHQGERKVDKYDADFEVLRKAIEGGSASPFGPSGGRRLPLREAGWSILRRKFAPNNMKEFVSTPRLSFHRVCSDSMLVLAASNYAAKSSYLALNSASSHSPSSSYSTSSSSSSSPPHPSPDSSISDHASESPAVSPPIQHHSFTPSNQPSFTNPPLILPEESLQYNQEFIEVDFSLPSPLRSFTTTPNKLSTTLAERRGSLSRALDLPVFTVDYRIGKDREKAFDRYENLENEGTNVNPNGRVQVYSDRDHCLDSSQRLASFGDFNEQLKSDQGRGFSITSEDVVTNPVNCCRVDPLVFRWPNLKKISPFGLDHMDSNSAFVFIDPSADMGKSQAGILYFWVGNSFCLEEIMKEFDSCMCTSDFTAIDWNHVKTYVASQLSMPGGTAMTVVKEREEPEEFLKLLGAGRREL